MERTEHDGPFTFVVEDGEGGEVDMGEGGMRSKGLGIAIIYLRSKRPGRACWGMGRIERKARNAAIVIAMKT